MQEDTSAVVDTLSQSYSEWQGTENANAFIQAAASYDLIFIVLGVSLIIWFVLLYFIIRVDRKVSKLEQQALSKTSQSKENDET